MGNGLINTVRQNVKYWWVSVLVGLVAVFLGFWFIAKPISALAAMAYVFAIGFFISGIFEIVFSAANRESINGWGWTLAGGIIDVLLGIFLIALPLPIIVSIFGFFVGFWVLFQSILGVGQSIDLQQLGVKGWGWLLAIAIVGIFISFIFIMSPIIAAGSFVVALASISFFIYGIFRIYLGFKLRSVKKEIEEVEK